MIAAILTLIIAVGAYSISQLQQHGQLRWSKEGTGFWDFDSDKRKYTSKIPFARTWLVFLTDGYHFMQFWMFNFLSLSFTFAIGWNWWIFGGVMIGVRLANWGARKLFSIKST